MADKRDIRQSDCLDEYIVQGETPRKQRAEHWRIAIGLQDVDGLENSQFLIDAARKHIEGELDLDAVNDRISDYYQTEEGRKLSATRTDEADIVAARIVGVLSEDASPLFQRNTPDCTAVFSTGCTPMLDASGT